MTKLNSITKILKKSKYVNNYTKLLLLLNNLNYYGDYYIPNKKLQRMLNINDKKNIRILLHQAEDEKIITLIYKDRKRYFIFNNEKNEEDVTKKPDLFDYNWLEDSED